jgi:hypothetical protein
MDEKVSTHALWHTRSSSEVVSGSGWVAVVSIERGDRGGSNSTSWEVVVAVLAELCVFFKRKEKVAVDEGGIRKKKKKKK